MTPTAALNLGQPPPGRLGRRGGPRPSFAADPRYDRVFRMERRRVVDIRTRYAVRGLRGVAVLAGAGAVGVAYLFSPTAAAALFSILFVAFAYAMPLAALSLILALSPIQNDLGGANSPVKFAPAELLMFLALPAALIKMNLRPRIGPTFLPTLFYLSVCAVASVDSVRATTIVSMFQMVLYMIIAVIVFSNLEHRPARLARVFDLYVLTASVLSLIGLYTNFAFLGTHKNGWGASLSTALIVAVDQWFQARSATRRRLMSLALVAIGSALVMTVSRGGWMAAMLGIAIVCAVRRQFGGLLKISLLLIPVACAAWYFLPQQLRDYAFGFEAGRDNIRLRYESVDKAMMWWQRDPLIGVGVGLRKEYDATNIVLLTLAESGWAGLIAFLAVQACVVYTMLRVVRRVRPDGALFSFATLAIALQSARLAHGLVDHYWSRGPITCAWASVGLATLAYQAVGNESSKRQRANVRLLTTRAVTGVRQVDDGPEARSPRRGRREPRVRVDVARRAKPLAVEPVAAGVGLLDATPHEVAPTAVISAADVDHEARSPEVQNDEAHRDESRADDLSVDVALEMSPEKDERADERRVAEDELVGVATSTGGAGDISQFAVHKWSPGGSVASDGTIWVEACEPAACANLGDHGFPPLAIFVTSRVDPTNHGATSSFSMKRRTRVPAFDRDQDDVRPTASLSDDVLREEQP